MKKNNLRKKKFIYYFLMSSLNKLQNENDRINQ